MAAAQPSTYFLGQHWDGIGGCIARICVQVPADHRICTLHLHGYVSGSDSYSHQQLLLTDF